MQPKLLNTTQGEYEAAAYTGKNESGLMPFGDRVLVLPDEAAVKTSGNVIIPDDVRERQSYAAETGVIVAIGDGAFIRNADRSGAFAGTKPRVGQRVFFDRYSGGVARGADGRMYRIMDDKAIGAACAD